MFPGILLYSKVALNLKLLWLRESLLDDLHHILWLRLWPALFYKENLCPIYLSSRGVNKSLGFCGSSGQSCRMQAISHSQLHLDNFALVGVNQFC